MSSRKPLAVHISQVPRMLTMLGAEGKEAQDSAIHELVNEMRNTKLKRPVKRVCKCMCGCTNVWRDEYDWLRSMGSCPQCQLTEHIQAQAQRLNDLISGEGL